MQKHTVMGLIRYSVGIDMKRYEVEGCAFGAEDGDWVSYEAARDEIADLNARVNLLQHYLDTAIANNKELRAEKHGITHELFMDLAYDDFDIMCADLVRYSLEYGFTIEMISLSGPGGGWPVFRFTSTNGKALRAFEAMIVGDR